VRVDWLAVAAKDLLNGLSGRRLYAFVVNGSAARISFASCRCLMARASVRTRF
jgi:hypothetical protein